MRCRRWRPPARHRLSGGLVAGAGAPAAQHGGVVVDEADPGLVVCVGAAPQSVRAQVQGVDEAVGAPVGGFRGGVAALGTDREMCDDLGRNIPYSTE